MTIDEVLTLNGLRVIATDDGRFLPVVSGGDGNDEDDSKGDPPPKDDDDNDDDEDDFKGKTKEPVRDPKARMAALEDQVGRLAKKLEKKDQEISDRDQRIKEFEDAQKGDVEKLEERAVAAEQRVAELEQEGRKLRISILVLEDDRLAGLSQVRKSLILKELADKIELDDDGTSPNLGELVDKLAEEDPGLFEKPSSNGQPKGEGGDEEGEEDQPKPSGRQPKTKKKAKDSVDRAQLESRFPALRRHRPSR